MERKPIRPVIREGKNNETNQRIVCLTANALRDKDSIM